MSCQLGELLMFHTDTLSPSLE